MPFMKANAVRRKLSSQPLPTKKHLSLSAATATNLNLTTVQLLGLMLRKTRSVLYRRSSLSAIRLSDGHGFYNHIKGIDSDAVFL